MLYKVSIHLVHFTEGTLGSGVLLVSLCLRDMVSVADKGVFSLLEIGWDCNYFFLFAYFVSTLIVSCYCH